MSISVGIRTSANAIYLPWIGFLTQHLKRQSGKDIASMLLLFLRIVAIATVCAVAVGNILYASIPLKIIGAIMYASFFEWTLHCYVMHRPVRIWKWIFDYAYNAHALVHHRIFGYDTTYHLINEKDKWTIPMAWWNSLVLIPATTLPFVLGSLLFGVSWSTPLIVGVVALAYYGTYESFHWCMHLPRVPKARLIERSWVFFRLNGHHILHHRYMRKNFNVILPLADLCLGTLRVRGINFFTQPKGPAVPDVQPRLPRREFVES